jgi:hypothetical protein
MEQGMASYPVVVSRHSGAATVKNISAFAKDPLVPRSNLPFQRRDVVLAPEREENARTSSKCSGVEDGTSIGAMGRAATFEQDTPVGVVNGK